MLGMIFDDSLPVREMKEQKVVLGSATADLYIDYWECEESNKHLSGKQFDLLASELG